MSNLGDILSNSVVKAPSIEASDGPLVADVDVVEVEKLRCLARASRRRQSCSRRVDDHRTALRAIIAFWNSFLDRKSSALSSSRISLGLRKQD